MEVMMTISRFILENLSPNTRGPSSKPGGPGLAGKGRKGRACSASRKRGRSSRLHAVFRRGVPRFQDLQNPIYWPWSPWDVGQMNWYTHISDSESNSKLDEYSDGFCRQICDTPVNIIFVMDESSSNQLESHLAVFIIIPNWCQKYHPKIHRSVSAKKNNTLKNSFLGAKKG